MLIQIRNTGSCSAWQSIDQYVMRGPSGEHVLSRDVTDRNRFEAHWKGFLENNGERYVREPETLGEFVEVVKQMSRDVVKSARRQHGGYCRPRELRISALDRVTDRQAEVEYVNASRLTQKLLREYVKAASFSTGSNNIRVFVDVGADWYESFQAFIEDWMYDPDVEADSIELPRKLVEEILK